MTEKSTSDLLSEWRLDTTTPANFDSGVWRRIEAQKPVSTWTVLSAWFSEVFSRPAVAVSYVAVAMVLGVAVGQIHSSKEIQNAELQAKARYIQTIDPYANPVTR